MGLLARLSAIVRLARTPKENAADEITAAEAARLREAGAVVVDVREGFEWRKGHVPGALHIPLHEVEARAAEIPKDKPVVMHCALGSRSALAARALRAQGYDVKNLGGGFRAWRAEGLPVEREE